MNEHEGSNKPMLRYVYMLDVDNRGKKSKYFGQQRILYTGQTCNILRRVKDHLHKKGSKFLATNFGDARKSLVYVDYVYGTEYDAIGVETELKGLNKDQKLGLIDSEQNKLVKYVPLKAVILKKYKKEDEQVCLRLDSNDPDTCPVGSES